MKYSKDRHPPTHTYTHTHIHTQSRKEAVHRLGRRDCRVDFVSGYLVLVEVCPMIDFMRLVEAEPFSSVSVSHSLQSQHHHDRITVAASP